MVTTRSGRQSGRYEQQRERLHRYEQQHDNRVNVNDFFDFQPNQPVQIAGYHIGHPHRHPGHYTDTDEHHRHRLRDSEPENEVVRTYTRRKALF